MTPNQRELFRQNLIAQLAAAGAAGIKLPSLSIGAQADGYACTDADIRNELDYLQDKGLAEPMTKLLSPENPRWKITAAGRDFAAQEGLG